MQQIPKDCNIQLIDFKIKILKQDDELSL